MKKKEIDKAANRLIILCVIGLIMIAIPIGVYIYNFKESNISLDPANWGSFGDFFGGILNPIISLFSLFLLGFISYYIAKESSNDNNSMNLRLRRMDAYEKLTQHLSSFERLVYNLNDSFAILNLKLKKSKPSDNMQEHFRYVALKLEMPVKQISEYRLYLNKFEVQYKHLFEYDFESAEFKKVTEMLSSLDDFARFFIIRLDSVGEEWKDGVQVIEEFQKEMTKLENISERYSSPLAKVLNAMQIEISN